jgi:hypothetical protein
MRLLFVATRPVAGEDAAPSLGGPEPPHRAKRAAAVGAYDRFAMDGSAPRQDQRRPRGPPRMPCPMEEPIAAEEGLLPKGKEAGAAARADRMIVSLAKREAGSKRGA